MRSGQYPRSCCWPRPTRRIRPPNHTGASAASRRFCPLIIDAMARARGCDADELRAHTTRNARALFTRWPQAT